MRLTIREKTTIVSTIKQKDSRAKIYLYGSRVRDELKGGDIDLLVISDVLSFSEKIDILMIIKQELGEQKIDLTIKTNQESLSDAWVKEVSAQWLELK